MAIKYAREESYSFAKELYSAEEEFGLAKLLSCRLGKEFGRLKLLSERAKLLW
ncbi:hypothetical protein [Candidatus Electronema sp. PJ]|uniref:hypothetical protein n=1 Tax=Candidatus Electronema sp. PJ TaxID=3401572 RepID=UPI003AA9E23F